MSQEITFEKALQQLEEAVAKLEKGQMPLDEALDCFERGVQSANLCRKQLQAVESRIETLTKDSSGRFATTSFAVAEQQDEDR